ncbi:helix-turn-helix domain-containing protein [Verticiella alkaliphila]|uniref:helix-turn-helix domain-containing protein n=1 Tax=Verticiella alkaliphila TaxID=2779529 RepID=UPI003530168C
MARQCARTRERGGACPGGAGRGPAPHLARRGLGTHAAGALWTPRPGPRSCAGRSRDVEPAAPLRAHLADVARQQAQRAVAAHAGNQAAAARALGVSRSTLWRRLRSG